MKQRHGVAGQHSSGTGETQDDPTASRSGVLTPALRRGRSGCDGLRFRKGRATYARRVLPLRHLCEALREFAERMGLKSVPTILNDKRDPEFYSQADSEFSFARPSVHFRLVYDWV